MPLHRLSTPSYVGGLPTTHDYINDPSSNSPPGAGSAANADGMKSGGPNDGTYYVAFGEDATSSDANRPHEALAENTDFLDDVVSGSIAFPDNVDGTAVGAVASLVITGDVFVGESGTSNNQDERDRLIKVLNTTTNNELITSSGATVKASLIHDGGSTNVVGQEASGFYTDPTVNFSPSIPDGSSYRIVYGIRGTLVDAISTKDYLDAFTRVGIRGSHEASGEVVRFIREAGRRTSGYGSAVAALTATILETPGTGESLLGKANAMYMDVDPDASQGTSGTWSVRFDRDSGPKVLFTVQERTAGNSYWQNTAERISFADVNTLASAFTKLSVDLSSSTAANGDKNLRLIELDVAATGESVSILKRLNAVFYVSVGNGTTTFGDFNGTSGLQDAIDYYNTKATSIPLYIVLKAGSYDLSDATLGTGNAIYIEGTHQTLSIISNTATSGVAPFTNTSGASRYVFRNIRIEKGNTSEVAISCGGTTHLENCELYDQQVKVAKTGSAYSDEENSLYMERCFSTMSSTTGAVPPVLFSVGSTSTIAGCIVLSSTFKVDRNAPVVQVTHTTGTAIIESIVFRDCKLYLAGTTTSVGDLAYPIGVMQIDPNGATGLTVRNTLFENCNVVANYASYGTNQILLHLVPDDGSFTATVNEFSIIGGRWDAGGVDSDITPFYVGPATFGGATTPVKSLVVKDVRWGFSAGSTVDYGAPAATWSFAETTGDWACFTIQAERIVMHSVEWLSCHLGSGSGDLFTFAPYVYDIDGLHIYNVVDNALVTNRPFYRFRFEGVNNLGTGSVGSIKNAVIRPTTTKAFAVATTKFSGLIALKPNGGMTLENCHVSRFSSGLQNGFTILEDANSWASNGLRMINCSATYMGGAGLTWDDTGVAGGDLSDLQIIGGDFSINSENGIRFRGDGSATQGLYAVHIRDCYIHDNTYSGIQVELPDWSNLYHGINITNCSINGNAGGAGGYQILFGGGTWTNGEDTKGVIMGNDCVNTSGQSIAFKVSSGSPTNVWGVHTGWDTSGATAKLAQRLFTSGEQMLENRSYLTIY